MSSKALVLVAAGAVLIAGPALAQEDRTAFQATTLRLSAVGEAHATPDLATITLGVQTEAPSAAEALRQNRVQMSATLDALKARGIEARDIQTAGLNLNAQYVEHQGGSRTLSGYQASNSVTVQVRDLSKLGAAVDAMVAAGANQIYGISFGLSDPSAAEDEARKAAVKALKAKAALYAEVAGYQIARLVSLSDSGDQPEFEQPHALRLEVASPPPTRVEPGELDVMATVSAVYELKKP